MSTSTRLVEGNAILCLWNFDARHGHTQRMTLCSTYQESVQQSPPKPITKNQHKRVIHKEANNQEFLIDYYFLWYAHAHHYAMHITFHLCIPCTFSFAHILDPTVHAFTQTGGWGGMSTPSAWATLGTYCLVLSYSTRYHSIC